MTTEFVYAGQELELFAQARNWKRYVHHVLSPYISGDVLEVGAGIGTSTRLLCDTNHRSWTALEPDAALAGRLRHIAGDLPRAVSFEIIAGTLEALAQDRSFDTVLYVDVMEHIEHDRVEFARAASRLAPGGKLIVLAPAYPWLMTRFDHAIGHHRRYTKTTLRAIGGGDVVLERLRHLDSAGLIASIGNRFLLKRALPTERLVQFWDRVLVPISRITDPLLLHAVGKSLLGVWRRA